MKRGGPLKAKSDKRAASDAIDKPIRDELVRRVGRCEVKVVLTAARGLVLDSVDRKALEDGIYNCSKRGGLACHERRKQSDQGSRTKRANLLVSCHTCNGDFIEGNPVLAHRLGLVVRQGDREWESLGKEDV